MKFYIICICFVVKTTISLGQIDNRYKNVLLFMENDSSITDTLTNILSSREFAIKNGSLNVRISKEIIREYPKHQIIKDSLIFLSTNFNATEIIYFDEIVDEFKVELVIQTIITDKCLCYAYNSGFSSFNVFLTFYLNENYKVMNYEVKKRHRGLGGILPLPCDCFDD